MRGPYAGHGTCGGRPPWRLRRQHYHPDMTSMTTTRGLRGLVLVICVTVLAACGGSGATGAGSAHSHLLGDETPAESIAQGPDGRWYATYADMVEVSAWPAGSAAPTESQRQAGEDLLTRVRATLTGLATVEQATAAGYEPHPAIDEFHLVHRAHVDDRIELDPSRPEFVLIDPNAGLVLGAMFLWPAEEHGPQFGGPDTVWHYHDARSGGDDFRCWDGLLPFPGDYDPGSDQCRSGTRRDRSPEMLHVWTIDHPQGPFATRMPARVSSAL
jgi:hypothetical protein